LWVLRGGRPSGIGLAWNDLTRLVSGHFMGLSEHPRAEWNDLWLLTEVHHEGKQPQVLEESVTSDTTGDKSMSCS